MNERLFLVFIGIMSGFIIGLGCAIGLSWFLFDATGWLISGPDGLGSAGFYFFASIFLALGGAIAAPLALTARLKKHGRKSATLWALSAFVVAAAIFLYIDPMGWFCCSAEEMDSIEVIISR